ncbi:DUF4286 family protein [Bergeyella porcorum]|uniref:DUF4286 family protein n=1 Tax=Bergeyella porcorum TaxID=1735111 RepID=UPI0035EEAA51
MSILSLTFHTTEQALTAWEQYATTELELLIDNLMDVEQYILSEVETEMITEGKNTNLLLIFDNEEFRTQFIENEFPNIVERIEAKFGDSVMIFKTILNAKKSRF